MSANKLAPNVVACAPEADPGNIDPKELVSLGWSPKLIDYLRGSQSGFDNLRRFESSQAERYEAEAPATAVIATE